VALFDMFETTPKPAKKVTLTVKPWTLSEKLAFEKELLGFYVTGHPLDEYRSVLEGLVPIAQLGEQEDKSTVTIGGSLVAVERKYTKKDSKPFAVVTVEDLTAQLEVMIWNETYTKVSSILTEGAVVQITGKVDLRDEERPRLAANEVKLIQKQASKERPLVLTLDYTSANEDELLQIRELIWQNIGDRKVEIHITNAPGGKTVRLLPGADFRIASGPEVEEKFARWGPRPEAAVAQG